MQRAQSKLTPKDVQNFRAIVFDMDGTLINSEPLHMEAIVLVLKAHGLSTEFLTPEFIQQSIGKADNALLKEIYPDWTAQRIDQFIAEKNQTLIKMLDDKTTQDLASLITPGVSEFLHAKREIGFPKLFLMTASEGPVVAPILKKAGLYEYFNEIFSRECTARTKPSSSPYLFLMRRYQLRCEQTLIFEDSPTGLAAAQESGSSVIRVAAHCPQGDLPQFSHLQSCDNFLWLC